MRPKPHRSARRVCNPPAGETTSPFSSGPGDKVQGGCSRLPTVPDVLSEVTMCTHKQGNGHPHHEDQKGAGPEVGLRRPSR